MKTTRSFLPRVLLVAALVAGAQGALLSTLRPGVDAATATKPTLTATTEHASLASTFPVGQARFARRGTLPATVGT